MDEPVTICPACGEHLAFPKDPLCTLCGWPHDSADLSGAENDTPFNPLDHEQTR